MSNPPKKDHPARKAVRSRSGALAVGAFVPGIARAAFEAHGFPTVSILSDWPEIIGTEFAPFTAPERLVWPRDMKPEPDDTPGRNARSAHRRAGATLVVRVEGPRAIEVQHMAPQLLERINVYFGYRAVAELRLIQGPVGKKQKQEAPCVEAPGEPPALDEAIEDEGLRAALSRLGAHARK